LMNFTPAWFTAKVVSRKFSCVNSVSSTTLVSRLVDDKGWGRSNIIRTDNH